MLRLDSVKALAVEVDAALQATAGSAGNIAHGPQGERSMLHYAVVFFIIALIAALFGFTGIAGASAGIAQVLFFIFLVLFVVSLLVGRRRPLP